MKEQLWQRVCALMIASNLIASSTALAQYAVEVVSYSAGSMPAAGFTNSAAALGSPERFTGEDVFPGVVTPFNPPFLTSEIVSVGEGGQLTLRLSHYATPLAGGPEIGVFTNAGLIDNDFPNGEAGSPAGAFGIDSALVDVSEDGFDWISLGEVRFDVPTNGYLDVTTAFPDVAGSMPSDFQQPFVGDLNSFDGLRLLDVGEPDILELLAGSGGGKWLDISGSGLTQVGYIRFTVADDGNPAPPGLNFELDAVSIARTAMGARTVPEPAALTLCGLALLAARQFRRPSVRPTE